MNDNNRAEREAGNDAISDGANSIAYQGEEGANSHVACLQRFPDLQPVPCATFEDALQAVKSGQAKYAMIPIENTLAGRVADVHHLLPHAGLFAHRPLSASGGRGPHGAKPRNESLSRLSAR